MMGGETPETCWITPKRQVINLWNCCILLVDLFESLVCILIEIKRSTKIISRLTLILLMWRIRWDPNNASKWHIGFNSAFKGLITKPKHAVTNELQRVILYLVTSHYHPGISKHFWAVKGVTKIILNEKNLWYWAGSQSVIWKRLSRGL